MELLERRAADAKGGGVGVVEFGMFFFELFEFAEQLVVFRVGDFRCGLIIIEIVVMTDRLAQLADAGLRRFRLG